MSPAAGATEAAPADAPFAVVDNVLLLFDEDAGADGCCTIGLTFDWAVGAMALQTKDRDIKGTKCTLNELTIEAVSPGWTVPNRSTQRRHPLWTVYSFRD